jgi:hypothetical protein
MLTKKIVTKNAGLMKDNQVANEKPKHGKGHD